MDTLDKVTSAPASPAKSTDYDVPDYAKLQEDVAEVGKDVEATAETVAEDVETAVAKVNWWLVAGVAAAGIGAVAGFSYWRGQQRRPQTRIERVRDQLGLSDVDFRHLRSTINRIDWDKLNESRHRLTDKARLATHKSALRVAELTR